MSSDKDQKSIDEELVELSEGIESSGREIRPDVDPRVLKEALGPEVFPSREEVEVDVVSKPS